MTKCHENLEGHNPSPWHGIMDHVKWHVKTLDHVAGWHKLPGASNSHDLRCSQLVLLYLFRFSFYLQGDHLWSGSKPWWVIMNLLACLFSKICFIIHLLFTLLWMAWEKMSWDSLRKDRRYFTDCREITLIYFVIHVHGIWIHTISYGITFLS